METMSFDAFGKRRNATNWQALTNPFSQLTNLSSLLNITQKGFTGHVQVDHASIIHMGGRIYDPVLGRFIQADPIVEEPRDAQTLNRYSYVLNNPLSYTDPTGYRCSTDTSAKQKCNDGIDEAENNADSSTVVTGGDSSSAEVDSNIKDAKLANSADRADGTNQNQSGPCTANCTWGQVIQDNWKSILRDTVQSTRETSPVADALVDFAGAEEIVEGSINMAEGNIKAGVQSATVAALGKIKVLRKAVDKISTGRTEPNSLNEKLAMEEVMSNPSGYTPPRMPKMSDTKNNLLHKDGWVKKTQNVNGVEIHYVENKNTKQAIDFKFKD